MRLGAQPESPARRGDARCCKARRPYTFRTYWTTGTIRCISDLVNDEVIP